MMTILASLLFGLFSLLAINASVDQGETYWLVKHLDEDAVQLTTDNIKNLMDGNAEKIVFLNHGYHGSRSFGWYESVTNSILSRYPSWNVIQVDWSQAASSPNYFVAVKNCIHVGENVGDFINNLIANIPGITADKIILVGHSLGAHVSGFAGKKTQTGGNIVSRIVGLDPAYPPWNFLSCDQRLCKTDAQFLSVIHTDIGSLGMIIPIGHADFYPTNGTNQPGCSSNHLCNHARVIDLFQEGVDYPDHFTSTQCSDYQTYITDPSKCGGVTTHMSDLFSNVEGIFYLQTNAAPPYSKN